MDGAKLQKRVTGGLVAFSGEVAKKTLEKGLKGEKNLYLCSNIG